MRIIFFDTETNGLPTNYKAPMNQVNNWPRIIQLAWQIADFDNGGGLVKEYKTLIKPDGWLVPTGEFWVKHGYTTAQNEQLGRDMAQVLEEFIKDYETCDLLCAHNIDFDYPILGAEMIRYQKRASKKLNRVCTMQNSIELCKIPFAGNRRGYKYPKLEELYVFLFGNNMQGAHDAGNDVTACRLSFFEMVKRGVIKMPQTYTFS